AEQGVEEVVRGADLLESVPRQRWLADALGVAPPRAYAHVGLVLGADGARLAKRHGAVTLADRAALGQSPADVRRELLAPFGLGDCVTMDELVQAFDPDRIR
ncbi:MAG TPA: glutamate--tRNA ligase family protein, partial [Solirubrobacteraceae bacterium]|nr:glutamate--tRNA ligase family protein [Solirubrobacteraceae bacterium]